MHIRFFSAMSWQWERLDKSIIDGLCHPKSLEEYWKDIIEDKCAAVEKAFLMTAENNVEGFYHRRLWSKVSL